MDSYEALNVEALSSPSEVKKVCGRRCSECGSNNTIQDSVLRPKPSILMVILFGWAFLLIRGALAMRTNHCHDCGCNERYKSTGSRIALVILIFLIICVVASLLDGGTAQ